MSLLRQGLVAVLDDSGLQDEYNISSWRVFRKTSKISPHLHKIVNIFSRQTIIEIALWYISR